MNKFVKEFNKKLCPQRTKEQGAYLKAKPTTNLNETQEKSKKLKLKNLNTAKA